VLKAIRKVAGNPLPTTEGGYGKPPGSHAASHLAGCLKIKLLRPGVRVVYRLVTNPDTMRNFVIAVREDAHVYRMLQERINKEKV
jgi:mRNA interferase RelE/StbE